MMSHLLNTLTLNIQSLRKHFDEFLVYLEELCINYDAIILTETWVYTDEIIRYQIPGYTLYAQCKDTQRSGGIVIYVKHGLIAQNQTSVMSSANVLHLQIKLENNELLSLIGVYRFCESLVSNFLAELEKVLASSANLAIFTGDINIDRSIVCFL